MWPILHGSSQVYTFLKKTYSFDNFEMEVFSTQSRSIGTMLQSLKKKKVAQFLKIKAAVATKPDPKFFSDE